MIRPAFDEWLDGTLARTGYLTSVALARSLAASDALVLEARLPVGGTAPTSIAVTMLHSIDGRNWQSKYVDPVTGADVPLLSATSFVLNQVNSITAGETTPLKPTLRFVQLSITYQGLPVRLQVLVIKRTRKIRKRTNADCGCESCSTCSGSSTGATWERTAQGFSAEVLRRTHALLLGDDL